MYLKLKSFFLDKLGKLKTTGFFHIFGSSVLNKIISFLSGIILVRVISKADYGIYTYANNIYGFFLLASGLGMASATLQMCSEQSNYDARLKIYGYGGRVGTGVNILLSLAMLAVAIFVKLPFKSANGLLAAMSFLPVLIFFQEQQMILLRAELRNKEYSYTSVFSAALTLLLSVLFALLLGTYGLIIASYLVAIATLFVLSKCFKVPAPKGGMDLDKKTKKDMWSISTISALNNGLSSLMYLLDIFVIGVFIPDETIIASYKIATTIPSALYFIPSSILIYAYPYFARNKDNKQWTVSNYKKLTLVSGAINFSIAAVLVALSSFIVPLIFGKQYSDAIPCFIVLCISFAFSGTFRMIGGNLLVTQRKLKFNLYISIFSSAFNTAMNVVLVLHWGSIGAAIATLLTALVTSITNTVYLRHVYKKLPE